MSRRFVDDVLYGFESIETAATGMIRLAQEVERIGDDAVEDEPPPPDVALVMTPEEAQDLLRDRTAAAKYGYVAMPESLLRKLERERPTDE